MRLFVALEIPAAVRDNLATLIDELRAEDAPSAKNKTRWVRPENLHVTLKFIGQVDAGKLDVIRAALAEVRSPSGVELRFCGLGFFPNDKRPRVFWAGIEASANLAPFAAEIDARMGTLEIPRETREFSPHLTLARFDSHKGLDTLVRAANNLKSYDFGSARQSEFYLYQSVLKRGGAEYTRLATCPFLEKA